MGMNSENALDQAERLKALEARYGHKMILGKYGRYASNADLMGYLGVRRLPDEGMPIREIHGVRVMVKAKPPTRTYMLPWGERRVNTSKHRIMAECSECRAVVSAGRLHQHRCKGGGDGK